MKNILRILMVSFFIISCEKDEASTMNSSDLVAYGFSANYDDNEALEEVVVEEVVEEQLKRKLIKNGTVSFETFDLNQTRETILNTVKNYKGYISLDNENRSEYRISHTINVRVPYDNFDNLLETISKGVEKFDVKRINITDVTEQFFDIETRLKNKKELEKRYLQILKKARTVKEILNVEREIGTLREEIEAAEGKLKYLKNQVSFSSLNITFYKQNFENESSSFWKNTNEAFINGFENIKLFLIFLMNVWPFIIIALLIYFIIRRRIIKNKKS